MTLRVSAPPKRNRSARQSGAVRGAGHHQTGPPSPGKGSRTRNTSAAMQSVRDAPPAIGPSHAKQRTLNVGAPPHLRRNHVFKAAIAHLRRRDCTASGAISGAFLVSRPLLQQSGLLSCRQGAASVRWEPRALAWRRCRTGPAVIPDRGKPGW